MASRLWVPVPSGPLAPYAAGYGSWLTTRGYSRWTVAHRLWQLDLLSRWLERERLASGELTLERVEEFVAARRAAGYSSWLWKPKRLNGRRGGRRTRQRQTRSGRAELGPGMVTRSATDRAAAAADSTCSSEGSAWKPI